MKVKDFLRYRNEEDKSTNVEFTFDGGLDLPIGVFDDEDEVAVFTIFRNKILLVADALPMNEIVDAFGKVYN